jgi:hypothetical protein
LLMNTPISEATGLALGVMAGVASAAPSFGGVLPAVIAHNGSPPHIGVSTDVNCTTGLTFGGGVSVVAASQNPAPATASPAVIYGPAAIAIATSFDCISKNSAKRMTSTQQSCRNNRNL